MTTEQLKKILKHMKEFTPIAMRCTQEQFNAVKPKLKSANIHEVNFFSFIRNSYLTNNLDGRNYVVNNVSEHCKRDHNREIHETWNEEIFLKACGIETETLQEKAIRLESELKEVKQQIEEENKIKVGDWVFIKSISTIYKKLSDITNHKDEIKITNPELIKLLEQEIK